MKRQLLYKIFNHISTSKPLEDFLKLIDDPKFHPEIIEQRYIEVYLHNSKSPTRIPAEQSKMTPIHVAAKNGRVDILELFDDLYDGINYDVETTSGWTPLMYASRHNQPKVVQFLLKQEVNYNKMNYDNEFLRKHAEKKLANTQEIFVLYPLQENNAASIAIKHNNLDCFKLLYPLHNEEERRALEELAKQYNRDNILQSIIEENNKYATIEETVDENDGYAMFEENMDENDGYVTIEEYMGENDGYVTIEENMGKSHRYVTIAEYMDSLNISGETVESPSTDLPWWSAV